MSNEIIKAISLLHKGERIIIEANLMGKFKVPVTSVENGQLRTRMRNLTARQVVEHEISKNCDPTLYLKGQDRVRVFQGGDSGYLPAAIDGIITKHDEVTQPPVPRQLKELLKRLDKPISNGYDSYPDYDQAHFDMYGTWPYEDDTDD